MHSPGKTIIHAHRRVRKLEVMVYLKRERLGIGSTDSWLLAGFDRSLERSMSNNLGAYSGSDIFCVLCVYTASSTPVLASD